MNAQIQKPQSQQQQQQATSPQATENSPPNPLSSGTDEAVREVALTGYN